MDVTTPAVVLKFDANPMHHGGLGVIRSLGRLGVPVFGVHEGRFAPAAHSRYLVGRWIWRPEPDDVERVHAGLLALSDRIGARAVLIPTDDAASIFLAEHGEPLRSRFVFPAPSPSLPRQLAGKHSLHLLCDELGFPTLRVVVPSSCEEARAFAESVGFPLVAKLTAPWRDTRDGARSTSIIHTPAELDELVGADERHGVMRHLLQEYVPSSEDADWFFHGYCDADSRCHPAFTGLKRRSYPSDAGLTSYGVSIENERLRSEVTDLLTRVGYRGICDLDIRYDARDDTYKLLDFNPRLGAQFRLFETTAGVDVAIAQYLDLTGSPIPRGTPVTPRSFLVECYDPMSSFAYWRGGELDARSWWGTARAADELAWFARDDLRPFGLMCARMVWRLATRPFSTSRGQRAEPRFVEGRAGGAAPTARIVSLAPAAPPAEDPQKQATEMKGSAA